MNTNLFCAISIALITTNTHPRKQECRSGDAGSKWSMQDVTDLLIFVWLERSLRVRNMLYERKTDSCKL